MHHLSFGCIILLLAGLSGCALVPPAVETKPAAPEPEPVPAVVVPQGTARELFKAGVDALQHGDGQKARPLLQQMLVLEPNNKNAPIAASLLSQIDADPIQILGKESFPYKVQSGDTLSLISKRFLGDPFKFYILAKYNELTTLDYLEAGRTIKIPGKKPPPAKAPVAEQPAAPEASSLRLSEARTLYMNGRYTDAINALEHIRSERGSNAESDDLLVTVYSAYAKKLSDAGQFGEANKLLSRALNSYPSNEHLKKQFEALEGFRNAEQVYKEANLHVSEGELEKAYAGYLKTLKLAPEHPGARAALTRIKPQLVEVYYTDAVRARRRQNYAEALSYLDKLLEIDSNHELAKVNQQEIKAILSRERSGRRSQ